MAVSAVSALFGVLSSESDALRDDGRVRAILVLKLEVQRSFWQMPPFLLPEDITKDIRAAFFEVYNRLDFGFLEHVYSLALERELISMGRRVSREVSVAVIYKGSDVAMQRLDFMVDDKVIIELKSTERLAPIAHRQLLSYLKSTRLEVGVLLHFGPSPKFHRAVASNSLPLRGTPLPAGPRSA